MWRVADLERSLRFYTEFLGMRLLRRKDYPEGKFTLAFVGYGDETDTAVIELTHNWGVDKYQLGNAFGHIAVAVDDAHKACEEVKRRGGKVTREAAPMKDSTKAIAVIVDPYTYKMAPITKPLAFFYTSSTNLTLLSHRDSRMRCITGGMSYSSTTVSGLAHLTKKCIVSKYSLSLIRFFR